MHSCWPIPVVLTIFEILTAVHLETSNVQININHLSSSFDAQFDLQQVVSSTFLNALSSER